MFKRGTHIQVNRLGYTHHGIYIGDDMVIHYSGFHKLGKKGIVSITSLESFCSGEIATTYNAEKMLKGDRFSTIDIIKRAKTRLNEDNYNIIFNNCEHFCNWCTHNDDYSQQTAGAIENLCRQNIYTVAGGMTIFDLISPFKKFLKK